MIPVPSESHQSTGFGQQVLLVPIKFGTVAQIFNIAEPLPQLSRFNAFGRCY